MKVRTWTTGIAAAAAVATLAVGAPLAQAEVPSTDIGSTLESDHFRVTAKSVSGGDVLRFADLEVCATDVAPGERVRVSWAPWELVDVDGNRYRAGAHEGGSDEADYPYGDGAPENGTLATERFLADGECATGAVSFAVPQEAHSKTLLYENGYGETLAFRLDS